MNRLSIAAVFFALAGAPAAHAATPMKGMGMKPAGVKTGSGVGVVKSIDAKAGTVTIQHEPIAAIGWPAMTMAFRAKTPAVLNAAKIGQKITFGVQVSPSAAEVTSITPR